MATQKQKDAQETALQLALFYLEDPKRAKSLAVEFGLWQALQSSLDELLEVAHARLDPNVFIEYAIETPEGRTVQADFHRKWQDLLTEYLAVCIGAPRGHGKSVQVASRVTWQLGKDCNLRVKIISSVDDSAEDIVSLIVQYIRDNARVQRVFPNLLLDYKAGVTKDEVYIQRTLAQRDPSIVAKGVLGAGAGGRADILVLDDCVDNVNAIINPSKRKTVINAIRDNWLPLLSNVGRIWWLCTPYHVEDATHVFRKEEMFDVVWWEPAITYHLQFNEDGTPKIDPETGRIETTSEVLWPAWWSEQKLALRRKLIGVQTFTRQYLLKVQSDEDLTFPEMVLTPSYESTLWKIGQAYPIDNEHGRIPDSWPTYGGIDLAAAVSDKGAFCVIWTLAFCPDNQRLYLKEMVRAKMKMPVLMQEIKSAFDRHHWFYALVENNAFQQTVVDLMDADHKHVPLDGAHTGVNKNSLLMGLPALATVMSKGLFVLPTRDVAIISESDTTPFGIFWNELTNHPGAAFSDTVMALWLAFRAYQLCVTDDIYEAMAGAASAA